MPISAKLYNHVLNELQVAHTQITHLNARIEELKTIQAEEIAKRDQSISDWRTLSMGKQEACDFMRDQLTVLREQSIESTKRELEYRAQILSLHQLVHSMARQLGYKVNPPHAAG